MFEVIMTGDIIILSLSGQCYKVMGRTCPLHHKRYILLHLIVVAVRSNMQRFYGSVDEVTLHRIDDLARQLAIEANF